MLPVVAILAVVAGVAVAQDSCTPDNCLNALTPIPNVQDPTSDCSSYLAVTQTLPATTVTIFTSLPPRTTTVTISALTVVTVYSTEWVDVTSTTFTTVLSTTTVTADVALTTTLVAKKREANPTPREADLIARDPAPAPTALARRQASSSLPPPYAAGNCTDPGQYASACSCLGVFPHTVTVPGSRLTATVFASGTVVTNTKFFSSTQTNFVLTLATTTVLATETVTSVTTVVEPATSVVIAGPCAPTPHFTLKAVGGLYNGQYAYTTNRFGSTEDVFQFSPSRVAAAVFSLDTLGHWLDGHARIANTAAADTGSWPLADNGVYFDTAAATRQNLTCTLGSNAAGTSWPLQCRAGLKTQFQTCFFGAQSAVVLAEGFQRGCTPFTFSATCAS